MLLRVGYQRLFGVAHLESIYVCTIHHGLSDEIDDVLRVSRRSRAFADVEMYQGNAQCSEKIQAIVGSPIV